MKSRGLNILLLTKEPFEAADSGGTQRVKAIANFLADAGHEVVPLAVRSPVEDRLRTPWRHLLALLTNLVRIGSLSIGRWASRRMLGRLASAQSRTPFDLTIVEYSQLMIYAPFVHSPVLLDLHNIESDILESYAETSTGVRSLIARHEARRVALFEAKAAEGAAAVVVVSDHDRATIRSRIAPQNAVYVCANGISDESFRVEKQPNDVPTAVFIGHLAWRPNIDAARWLALEVWPRLLDLVPVAQLQIIGKSPPDQVTNLATSSVSIHPNVPSTHAYLRTAHVATAPLLASGGTRLKILEALATGTPVVATTRGALGLETLCSSSMAVVDDPADFASALAAFFRDPGDASICRTAVSDYRWESTLSQLNQAISRVELANRGGAK